MGALGSPRYGRRKTKTDDRNQGDGTTARLAGQQSEYLFNTMTAFRDGSRANNPGMSDLMNAVQPSDLKPLADYLASLQVIAGQQ